MTIQTGGVHRYPLPPRLFHRLIFETHLDALHTPSALLWFKVGLSIIPPGHP